MVMLMLLRLPRLALVMFLAGCPHDFTRNVVDLGTSDLPQDQGVDQKDLGPDQQIDLYIVPDFGCSMGTTLCGEVCVDVSSDEIHCGGCDTPCAVGQDCVGGTCQCITGGLCQGCCDGDVCLPPGPNQSLAQCGSKGEACQSCTNHSCSADSCTGGACQHIPNPGFCLIEGVCVKDGDYKSTLKCLQCQSNKSNQTWTSLPQKGCVATVAGSGVKGFADGPQHLASFNLPNDIVVDGASNVYVADGGNHRIRKIAGDQVSTFAGTGTFQSWPMDKAALFSTFKLPFGLTLEGSTLYVTEMGFHTVRTITGGMVTTLAGADGLGLIEGPALKARFDSPAATTVVGNVIYVADHGNHRIRKIENDQVSTFAGTVQGFWNGHRLSASFNLPTDLLVDSAGAIYVADQNNHCIRKIENDMVTTLAGTCNAMPGLINGPATSALFNHPIGLAFDSSGALFIADWHNHSIRKLAGGQVTTLTGSGKPGDDDGPLTTATFHFPSNVAVDSAGKIYVADHGNNKIRVIIP